MFYSIIYWVTMILKYMLSKYRCLKSDIVTLINKILFYLNRIELTHSTTNSLNSFQYNIFFTLIN